MDSSKPKTRSTTGFSFDAEIFSFISTNICRDPIKMPCRRIDFIKTGIGLNSPAMSRAPMSAIWPPVRTALTDRESVPCRDRGTRQSRSLLKTQMIWHLYNRFRGKGTVFPQHTVVIAGTDSGPRLFGSRTAVHPSLDNDRTYPVAGLPFVDAVA